LAKNESEGRGGECTVGSVGGGEEVALLVEGLVVQEIGEHRREASTLAILGYYLLFKIKKNERYIKSMY
jgi:hypothetical protein